MPCLLTHWGRVTHICVGKLIILGSDNGLSPGRRQAIIWTNAGILLIGPLGTNFSEILIEIYIFSFKKMHLKMSSGNWQPFCLGLNVFMPSCGSFRRHVEVVVSNIPSKLIFSWKAHQPPFTHKLILSFLSIFIVHRLQYWHWMN